MTAALDVSALTERLAAGRQARQQPPAEPEPALQAAGLDAAYRVQDALVARLGGGTLGFKIGASSQRAQDYLGLTEPFSGQVLTSSLHRSPARLPADAFRFRLIEPEFAVTLAQDLPARSRPYGLEEAAAAVATVHPAIEVVTSAFGSAWTGRTAAELVADNGAHGALVLGEGCPPAGLDLANHAVELRINGLVKGRGTGSNALGHPFAALAWLASRQAATGRGLKAGEVVTTGVVTEFVLVEAGEEATAEFGTLGEVRVSFEN